LLTILAPPKKDHQGRDRHTKGPREDRSHTGPRSRAPGAAGARGPKGGNRGGRGGAAGAAGAEKKTGAAPAENWTNEEGKAELSAENQGEKDVAEEGAETPAPAAEEAEPEDNSKTLDQYLAERASAALGGQLAKKEARQVADDVEGKQFEREEMENFFGGSKVSHPFFFSSFPAKH
jgi:plasminogen activator inhibitor 1 RNA-binding protein